MLKLSQKKVKTGVVHKGIKPRKRMWPTKLTQATRLGFEVEMGNVAGENTMVATEELVTGIMVLGLA